VVGEGNSRDTSVHPTQHHAIERAREIAQNQRSEVVIHGEDGPVGAVIGALTGGHLGASRNPDK